MRYELDINGYISTVVWGCLTGNCIEYTGTVPSGYTDLADWADRACIEAYYIEGGNLVLDTEKQAECQAKTAQETIDNAPVVYKDLHEATQAMEGQYQTASTAGKVICIENAKNIAPIMKISNTNEGRVDIYANGKQLLKNDAKTETISGVTFTRQIDNSVKINGTSTSAIKYTISGSDTNTTPICALKDNIDYFLDIGGYECEMKYFDGESTSQVYTGDSGLIDLSENKIVTQIILKIPAGTTINNDVITPTLNVGTSAITYEDYKVRKFSVDFSSLIGDGLYPSDDLFPSATLYPRGDSINYVLIKDGQVMISKNNIQSFFETGNVNIFNGDNTIYTLQDTFIELTYSTSALNVDDLEFLQGKETTSGQFKIREDGSIEANNGYFSGDIYIEGGGKVLGGEGLLTNLSFSSFGTYHGFDWLGYDVEYNAIGFDCFKRDVPINAYIPENFTVKKAYVTIEHAPINWSDVHGNDVWGYSRNIRLYKANTNVAPIFIMAYGSSYQMKTTNMSGTEIQGAFGSNGYTATNQSVNTVETVNSIDITDKLSTGTNVLFLRTNNPDLTNAVTCCEQTGNVKATLTVIGYMTYEEESDE